MFKNSTTKTTSNSGKQLFKYLHSHIMLGSMSPRSLMLQLLNFAFIMSTAFMMWKGLSIAADSPSPIVVVLSGSMEPAFQRGDLLFLWNRWYPTDVADIVVYKVKDKEIPIVHRVISTHGAP
jgi:signal peptidase